MRVAFTHTSSLLSHSATHLHHLQALAVLAAQHAGAVAPPAVVRVTAQVIIVVIAAAWSEGGVQQGDAVATLACMCAAAAAGLQPSINALKAHTVPA